MLAPVKRLPQPVTDPIEVALTAATTITIRHDLGRPVTGWLVVWSDAHVKVYVDDPDLPTDTEITLMSDTSANARIVLMA